MELTTSQKIIQRQLLRSYYRKSFYQFFKASCQILEPTTKWSWNFHHEYICNVLQQETLRIKNGEPKLHDIIINVPFRSSKSLMVSIVYPIWCWLVKNDMKFICLSYSESLAGDHAGKCQLLLESDWFRNLFPEIKLKQSFESKTDFMIETGGSRFAAGFLGSVLGKGADIIIMDDPNRMDSLNPLGLNTVNDTYKNVIYGRLNNPAVGYRLVIQQRLAMQDLTGYLLENYPDTHMQICLPAELSNRVSPLFLANDYKDNLMWKDRFSKEVLQNYKEMLGTKGYNNQLMQTPIADEGSILKKAWFNIIPYDDSLSKLSWQMFVDTAYGKEKGDASAVLICARRNNEMICRYSGQYFLEFPDLVNKLKDLYNQYHCHKITIEPKANGISVIQQIRRDTKMFVSESHAIKDDKVTRTNAISPVVEGKRISLVDGSWTNEFIEEVCSFPFARYDDRVDTLLLAVEELLNVGTITWKNQTSTPKDRTGNSNYLIHH